jgi:hypothetical protein
MLSVGLSLAFVWGVVWALFLQFTTLGRFLATRRTWITVAIGVGVDAALLLLCLPFSAVLTMLAVVGASAIGIVARSMINELNDELSIQEYLHGHKDAGR